VSKWLFCPTAAAVKNLHAEGVDVWDNGAQVHLVGDVMLDGALFYKDLAVKPDGVPDDDFVLSTIHRAENTGSLERMTNIVGALNEISRDKNVVLPLHPRTRKIISEYGLKLEGVTIIDPVGYLNMVWLIANCDKVITDSGGLQKEAYFFSKPCITLRDETEWVELVDQGVNKLVGSDYLLILDAVAAATSVSFKVNEELYGGGDSAAMIVRVLMSSFPRGKDSTLII
jgi:UDP-GlcNAc3NAcA epimerase